MRISASPIELNPATRTDPARIDQVARQLEGQFAQMLIKSMREASFGDSLFPGENQMFREMHDQKIAESMTRGKGLGLSAIIARQLGGGDAAPAPALDTRLNPADAARAYQLTAPAASRPFDASALEVLTGDEQARVLEPMEQALDLIAGRETSSLHSAQGRNQPYTAMAMATGRSSRTGHWMTAGRCRTRLPASAAARRAASTCRLPTWPRANSAPTPRKASSRRSGRMPSRRPGNSASTHAPWSPRPRSRPAGAAS
jgi:Rod binding protein